MRVVRFLRECIPSLPRAVWLLQLGNVVNMFGFGLILPFEIVYLHDHRGIAVPVAGLVLSTVMATSSVVAAPAGTLIDRFGGKRLVGAGTVFSAAGYAGFAFVPSAPSAFAAALVAGLGAGLASAAVQSLMAALTTRTERAAAFSFGRVSVNLGIGAGTVVGGLAVAGGSLHAFQVLYLVDAATFIAYLFFLQAVPDARSAHAPADGTPRGYRAVLGDRMFLVLLLANMLWVMVAYMFFASILGPYVRHVADFGSPAIGAIFAVNTAFIILAQLPLTRVASGRNRLWTLKLTTAVWIVACLAMIPAARLDPEVVAVAAVALAGIAFGVGECLHAIAVGPLASDIARPELMGRYMALFALSWSVGFALGPAAGSALLAASSNLPWLGGAVLLALTFPLLALLSRRLPEDVQQVHAVPALAE